MGEPGKRMFGARTLTKVGLCLALALAGFVAAAEGLADTPAGAPRLQVGVADDAAKFAADGGAAQFARMASAGLTSLRVSVLFDPTHPETLADRAGIDRVAAAAADGGVQLVFALYADPRIAGQAKSLGSRANADAFCNWAAGVARSYPSITRFIVGNEPNQPRFWQPQFSKAGRQMSAWQYEYLLARCYDALKAVSPAIDVIGLGLSPRGNDSPTAKTNSSTSPLRFLQQLGLAYRASGRTLPLMDELSVHCYPRVNTDPVSRGYPWPNVGCVDFGRIKQGVWDAFDGTAQPTFAEGTPPAVGAGATGGCAATTAPSTTTDTTSTATTATDTTSTSTSTSTSTDTVPTTTDTTTATTTTTTTTCETAPAVAPLTLVVDETGWQTTSPRAGYVGKENVPLISEAKQAVTYRDLVQRLECDPSITALHFLYLRDSTNRADFQSGLMRADGTPRPSLAAVQAAIGAGCAAPAAPWQHLTTVAAPRVLFSSRLGWQLRAGEGVQYRATEYAASSLAAARATAQALQQGTTELPLGRLVAVKAGTYASGTISLRLPRPGKGGVYVVAVQLRASSNPARTAVVVASSRP